MIVFNGQEYDSKAAIVRTLYLSGSLQNTPEDKKNAAAMLGMTVQTVHATLVKMIAKLPGAPAPSSKPQVVKITNNFAEVRKLVEDRYNECYEIAKAKGVVVDLPKIDIRWDLKGRVAGQFCWRNDYRWFNVNLVLAKENLEDYLAQTVPHEFSHYIDYMNWKRSGDWKKPSSHGWSWKRIMLTVFGREPARCHSYDTSSVARKTRKFEYKCGCRSFPLGPSRHHKLQINPRKYICWTCNSHLTFVKAI